MSTEERQPRRTPRDRFLGCLLGLAIGDALGMPVEGWTAERIEEAHGWVTGYLPRIGEQGEVIVPSGEFTGDTELALCHLESIVSASGFIDPEGTGVRFQRLLRSESRRFLGRTTLAAIERMAEAGDYQSGVGGDWPPGNGAAGRIAPVGLLHVLGRFNPEIFTREVLRAALITHCEPESINGALALAYGVRLLAAAEIPPEVLIDEVARFVDEDEVARRLRLAGQLAPAGGERAADRAHLRRIGTSSYVAESVAAAFYCFASHPDRFDEAVLTAVNAGGDADSIAAMTGALSGAHLGATAIPVSLVDGLEGRMYILVSAPSLYRTAQRRAGLFLAVLERE